MAYRFAGTYVGHCSCLQVCPCAVDQPPTGPDGVCRGLAVFGIREGNLDDVDLAGVNFVLSYFVPSNFSAGNWKQGLVIDEGASDEQVDALERIMTGKEGGPFEDFAALVSEWLGVERTSVTVSDGEAPSAAIGGTQVNFEPFRSPEGKVVTVSDAPFGLAPKVTLGKSSGRSGLFGDEFDAVYGEAAEFEYSSEGH